MVTVHALVWEFVEIDLALEAEFSDILGMSLEITEELIGRQPLESQAINRVLLAKIQERESRLNKNPRNSSLPPSTRHPHARQKVKKSRSKRKRGGQPEHANHERPLLFESSTQPAKHDRTNHHEQHQRPKAELIPATTAFWFGFVHASQYTDNRQRAGRADGRNKATTSAWAACCGVVRQANHQTRRTRYRAILGVCWARHPLAGGFGKSGKSAMQPGAS